ncbi:ComEC/Rec2 family competence protein [Bacillus mycoides]|uniref:ComEC/Rec2 family competence protein n=1 Tax=Bacillus mycoides TaxID=1405 RepID=UPI001C00F732|nr:hypothetical protein [Bacillus mycoides]QWG36726.1 hypothetical protein EXW30_28450 [Bacillus mycoides]
MSMKIKSLPAHDGDCFIISFGEGDDIKNIIIDGGRRKPVLKRLKEEVNCIKGKNQSVDLLIVTHIDEDHIQGILKMFEDYEIDKSIFKQVWFNSKENLTSFFDGEEKEDEKLIIEDKSNGNISYGQGISFGKLLHNLGLTNQRLILAGEELEIGNAVIKVLSPNEKSLKRLHQEWEKVFPSETIKGENVSNNDSRDYKETIEDLAQKSFKEDNAIVNGSSIAFSIEYKNKKVLMLADSFPSIVLENLNKFYPQEQSRNFDLIKISHHASKFNTSDELLNFLKCKRYLVSTNGKTHGFPTKETLARIIVSSYREKSSKTYIYFNYSDVFEQIFYEKEMLEYNFQCIHMGNNKEEFLEV